MGLSLSPAFARRLFAAGDRIWARALNEAQALVAADGVFPAAQGEVLAELAGRRG